MQEKYQKEIGPCVGLEHGPIVSTGIILLQFKAARSSTSPIHFNFCNSIFGKLAVEIESYSLVSSSVTLLQQNDTCSV